jgi:hypothetical protein
MLLIIVREKFFCDVNRSKSYVFEEFSCPNLLHLQNLMRSRIFYSSALLVKGIWRWQEGSCVLIHAVPSFAPLSEFNEFSYQVQGFRQA